MKISFSSRKELEKIAERQHGYFTRKQAIAAGYVRNNHHRHVTNHKWLKISTGLLRLPGYEDSMESDFTKWCLWSRNQRDQVQGIISHDSALALYGLAEYNPRQIHLTVSGRFRKDLPEELVVYRAALKLSVLENHDYFIVTRLGQTLLDMRDKLKKNGAWQGVLDKAVRSRQLSDVDISMLDDSGVVQKCPMNGNHEDRQQGRALEFKAKSTDTGGISVGQQRFDPVSQGVWDMIYRKTSDMRRHSRAGFTLVELLVVITIISILSSMLLPALGKAREAAYKAACLSNMKQYGAGILMYVNDNRGYIPASWGFDDALREDYVPKQLIAGKNEEDDHNPLLQCDSANSEYSDKLQGTVPWPDYFVNVYRPNSVALRYAIPGLDNSSNQAYSQPVPSNRINNPSIAKIPVEMWSPYRHEIWGLTADVPSSPYNCHESGRNLTFLDGHVVSDFELSLFPDAGMTVAEYNSQLRKIK